jgi:hypothetical protein
MIAYNAFISYSHEADEALAADLERALEALARPWYKRRALSVFRDGGNLNLSSHLWRSIQNALDASDFFVYLASPAAARSPWVARELEYWISHRDIDRLIFVLTDGSLNWLAEGTDFDTASTAVPPVLQGVALRARLPRSSRSQRDMPCLRRSRANTCRAGFVRPAFTSASPR